MTPGEINSLLTRDAEGVASMLLPNGQRDGHEWRAGSVDGEAGKSLGVHLTGEKAGVWSDFATGERGDLLDLWAVARNIPLKDAIAEAKVYLGIREPQFHAYQPKRYRRPDKPKCQPPAAQSAVLVYLTEQRKLTEETISAYRIAERGREIVLPSLRDGQLIAVKYLGIDRPDGKKKIRVEADCEPCLFGWQAVPVNAREVVITEGEIDAMSLYQYGFPALSVPFGGGGKGKQAWIEHEFEHLERFDTITLCLDRDAPGRDAAEEIIERLGRHRCRVVELPEPWKDANDLLTNRVSAEQVQALFAKARTLDPTELKPAAEFVDAVIGEFYPSGDEEPGFSPPWERLSARLRFRRGELCLLAGVNGHGKSEVAGHLTLDALAQGERACIASLEFKPAKWLRRLTRQAAGLAVPSVPFIRAIHQWYAERLWVFDAVGTAKAEQILEVFAYARRRYGIHLFVIDNLAKCGLAEDDFNGQKAFVDRLTDFAKEHDAHVLLVLHMRKRESEDKPAGKMDIKGTGALTDMADTVLTVWRNKPKEEVVHKAESRGDPLPDGVLEQPDAVLACHKQRNGEDEPKIALWFDRASHQYVDRTGARPRTYVNFSIRGQPHES